MKKRHKNNTLPKLSEDGLMDLLAYIDGFYEIKNLDRRTLILQKIENMSGMEILCSADIQRIKEATLVEYALKRSQTPIEAKTNRG